MTDKTRTTLPMACVCQDPGEEAAIARRKRVAQLLDVKENMQRWMSTDIIYALNCRFKHSWSINGVYADMWMMVSMEEYTTDREVVVTCDFFEDGLVALFLFLYDSEGFDE